MDEIILRLLRMDAQQRDLSRWTGMLERMQNPEDQVDIALIGKYVEYEDSYKSLKEALLHGALAHRLKVNIHWIESDNMRWPECARELEQFDGILVPGGFGKRGVEGMISAIRYARESKVPYFGICLGMQTMVIEFARNVCGLEHANSTEFDPATPDRVIYKLRELKGVDELGGTMRLGAYPCLLAEGSFARQAYGEPEISERHRHRYEFNREYEEVLTSGRAAHRRANAGCACTSRSARFRIIPGIWAASSIRSSSRSRWSRIRCSRPLSARRTSIARAAPKTAQRARSEQYSHAD